jgi:hypothetical protein
LRAERVTNALRQRDDRNQLRPVISLIGVTQIRIATARGRRSAH